MRTTIRRQTMAKYRISWPVGWGIDTGLEHSQRFDFESDDKAESWADGMMKRCGLPKVRVDREDTKDAFTTIVNLLNLEYNISYDHHKGAWYVYNGNGIAKYFGISIEPAKEYADELNKQLKQARENNYGKA